MKPLPRIDPPLLNASGILSYPEVFETFERQGAALGGYVTKSVGPAEKEGNNNPVVVYSEAADEPVLNSLALPTQSPGDWEKDLSELRLERSQLIVSIYGGTPAEFASVAERMAPFADAIEINLGCPNKEPGEVTIMESIGQNPALCGEVMKQIRAVTDKPLIAKLSPNSDYLAVAQACLDAGADALGCGNTLGPGLAIDPVSQKPILAGTTGGISGPALKPINLRMTYEAYARFACPIIAYGGIATWRDAVDYALAGACILGIGTAFLGRGTLESVALTQDIWNGVGEFLRGAPFESIVGASHRNREANPAHA